MTPDLEATLDLTNNTLTIVYHGGCPDGVLGAVIVRRRFRQLGQGADIRCFPAQYASGRNEVELPDMTGHAVVFVDFCVGRAQLERVVAASKATIVIDHHETTIKDFDEHGDLPKCTAVLDTERSGCGLAWDVFGGGGPRPWLVRHIEDRDLWRFRYGQPTHDAFAAFTSRYFENLDYTDELLDETCAPHEQELMYAEGAGINRYRRKLIAEAVANATMRTIAGHRVPVANCPYNYGSDVANDLAEGHPFAAYFYVDAAGIERWGLRSTPDGLNVAEIAETLGGGGHKHASGFRVNPVTEIRLEAATSIVWPNMGLS